eukprot:Awhi_evm2s14837
MFSYFSQKEIITEKDVEKVNAMVLRMEEVAEGKEGAYTMCGQKEILDRLFYLRFLKANYFDLELSLKMLEEYFDWRINQYPEGVKFEENKTHLESGVITYMTDFKDSENRPTLFIRGGLFQPTNFEDANNLTIFGLDTLIKAMDKDVEQFCGIIDLTNFGTANIDAASIQNVALILQKFYPERLGHCWIIHSNWMFSTMWSLIKPFLNEKTAAKVTFVPEATYEEDLANCFDVNKLPRLYGCYINLFVQLLIDNYICVYVGGNAEDFPVAPYDLTKDRSYLFEIGA